MIASLRMPAHFPAAIPGFARRQFLDSDNWVLGLIDFRHLLEDLSLVCIEEALDLSDSKFIGFPQIRPRSGDAQNR